MRKNLLLLPFVNGIQAPFHTQLQRQTAEKRNVFIFPREGTPKLIWQQNWVEAIYIDHIPLCTNGHTCCCRKCSWLRVVCVVLLRALCVIRYVYLLKSKEPECQDIPRALDKASQAFRALPTLQGHFVGWDDVCKYKSNTSMNGSCG